MKFTAPLPIRKVLLCCLILVVLLAFPVGSQAQTRLTNPSGAQLHACGLPTTWAVFTSVATVTTFNMTADCTFSNMATNQTAFLFFHSGTFTINGNGHSIIGPTSNYNYTIHVNQNGPGTILNLNNVTIRQSGSSDARTVSVFSGARLNGRNVIFRNNTTGAGTILANLGGQVHLENVQFLNNRKVGSASEVGSALDALGGSSMVVTNGIFRGNSGTPDVLVANGSGSSIRLEGRIAFCGNVQADGTRANNYMSYNSGTVTDNSDPASCPKPKRKEKVPTATPTPRPQAVTCPVLAETIGVVVDATYGMGSGVQCKQLDGGGIGVAALADSYILAVDIFGYVEQGVDVCFPQAGRLFFLDSRYSPRTMSLMTSTVVDGMTCTSIDTAGSIVLMPPD